MVIVTRQKNQLGPLQLQLTLEKTRIEQVYEHRVLSVIVNDEMKRQSHLNYLCKSVSKNVLLLSQPRHYGNAKTRKLCYSAHILSHINYVIVHTYYLT